MERWIRQNHKVLLPWTLLGLEVIISVGIRLYKLNGSTPDNEIIPSPLEPKLSEAEADALPYAPDAYPGARDVVSPYGSLRVYEWGLEGGRKVVLVHGISNPSIALGAIAHGLVDRGCRVILFDLPGRGYSSTPVPTPHSARLFTTSILLTLTSSPIPWTGNGTTFSMIGYSLGGGIVANFTSYFPSLVSSLVLLAPSGLVRPERVTLINKLLYNTGLINETTVESIVRNRLKRAEPAAKPTEKLSIETAVEGELPNEKAGSTSQIPVLSRSRPGTTIANIVGWQVDTHPGYVKSFVSSIRHGPITNQHSDWRRIGERLAAQNASSEERYAKEGLQNGQVLIILGKQDVFIVDKELVPDATDVLGEGVVRFESVDAGHDLPVSKSEEILAYISDFWQL